MSNSAKWNQTLKICGITKIKSDIILLSDIRLSNKNLVSCAGDIEKFFLNNPYEKYKFFHNSSKNKRGVGILIKNSMDFEYLDRRASTDENILALHCKVNSTELLLVSIYGPNSADPGFFVNLSEYLNDFKEIPIICGGDWNATFCTNNVPENVDCLNMARPPNTGHSKKIHELCEVFSLADPYQHFYPDMRDFTYVPQYADAINKS
jgi:exonuclease III